MFYIKKHERGIWALLIRGGKMNWQTLFPDKTAEDCLNKVEIGQLDWLITELIFKDFLLYIIVLTLGS